MEWVSVADMWLCRRNFPSKTYRCNSGRGVDVLGRSRCDILEYRSAIYSAPHFDHRLGRVEANRPTSVEVKVSYDVTVYGILSVLYTVVQKLETTVTSTVVVTG